MSKITPETKQLPQFTFAKVYGLTDREASRFASLFKDEADFKSAVINESLMVRYIAIAKEPQIRNAFDADTLTTRSKVVMAYERQRKAYNKIREIRLEKTNYVDSVISDLQITGDRTMTMREQALQQILRFL
jgi:hypothetical protein